MSYDQWLNKGNPADFEYDKETLKDDLINDVENIIKIYQEHGLDADEVIDTIKEML